MHVNELNNIFLGIFLLIIMFMHAGPCSDKGDGVPRDVHVGVSPLQIGRHHSCDS